MVKQSGGGDPAGWRSPPAAYQSAMGAMKMLVRDGELVLDAAQMKYVFKKEQ